jgi:hypothetical protein
MENFTNSTQSMCKKNDEKNYWKNQIRLLGFSIQDIGVLGQSPYEIWKI